MAAQVLYAWWQVRTRQPVAFRADPSLWVVASRLSAAALVLALAWHLRG